MTVSDSPRRARATGWAWACLALFGPDAEDAAAETADPGDEEPSEGSRTSAE